MKFRMVGFFEALFGDLQKKRSLEENKQNAEIQRLLDELREKDITGSIGRPKLKKV
ncbi:MAG: hypothetical protein ACRD8W_01655 [Nitrososphaeraceae archaeon]